MVTLSSIRATNTRLRDTLPPNLVSLFVGGTSGIGEATLLELASHSRKPKIYIVARRAEAGERVIAAARKANPDGEYVFVPSDAGSMRETEGLAAYIAAREQRLDLVLLSAGLPLINKESALPPTQILNVAKLTQLQSPRKACTPCSPSRTTRAACSSQS